VGGVGGVGGGGGGVGNPGFLGTVARQKIEIKKREREKNIYWNELTQYEK